MSTTFGDNIRKYRELKNMTQESLALALGYKTKGAVNKIEKNVSNLPQPKIKLCADILGVPVAKLFSNAEPTIESYEAFKVYLPYLAQADEAILKSVRILLGMPLVLGEKKENGSSPSKAIS